MDYYQKYLKYKEKYLNLKNMIEQKGGDLAAEEAAQRALYGNDPDVALREVIRNTTPPPPPPGAPPVAPPVAPARPNPLNERYECDEWTGKCYRNDRTGLFYPSKGDCENLCRQTSKKLVPHLLPTLVKKEVYDKDIYREDYREKPRRRRRRSTKRKSTKRRSSKRKPTKRKSTKRKSTKRKSAKKSKRKLKT